jgi:thymidylate synthase ThyX
MFNPQSFEAKVIEDSVSPDGVRLVTMQLRYPRFVHAEFMTHRVFSRNASSSRAIPVAKMIEQVRTKPAKPVHWGKNQPGMQARAELEGIYLENTQALWEAAASHAADIATVMERQGAHKQVVNRILEPFQWISVIVTATEWDNFFELRDHPDADPNIALLARMMKSEMDLSTPVRRGVYNAKGPTAFDWHLPYVTLDERTIYMLRPRYLAKLSAARCARVSYLTHEGKVPDPSKDVELYDKLVGSRPLHASPVEHQAYPAIGANVRSGNFRGWVQHRKLVEAEVWGDAGEPVLVTEDGDN